MNPKKLKKVTKFIKSKGVEIDLNPFLESYIVLERVFNDFRIDANWFFCENGNCDEIEFKEPKEFKELKERYVGKLELLVGNQKESLNRLKKI